MRSFLATIRKKNILPCLTLFFVSSFLLKTGNTDDRFTSLETALYHLKERLDSLETMQGENSENGSSGFNIGPLLGRLQTMEADLKDLRGDIERLTYRVQNIEHQLQVFQADVDTRFRQQQQVQPSPAPLPSTPDHITQPSVIGGTIGSIDQLIERESKESSQTHEKKSDEGAKKNQEKLDFNAIQTHFSKNKFKEALSLSEKFLQNYPNSSYKISASLTHGRCLQSLGQHQKAAAYLMKTYKNNSKSKKAGEILYYTARSLSNLGKKEESCAILEKILEDHKTTPESLKKSIENLMKKQTCE